MSAKYLVVRLIACMLYNLYSLFNLVLFYTALYCYVIYIHKGMARILNYERKSILH